MCRPPRDGDAEAIDIMQVPCCVALDVSIISGPQAPKRSARPDRRAAADYGGRPTPLGEYSPSDRGKLYRFPALLLTGRVLSPQPHGGLVGRLGQRRRRHRRRRTLLLRRVFCLRWNPARKKRVELNGRGREVRGGRCGAGGASGLRAGSSHALGRSGWGCSARGRRRRLPSSWRSIWRRPRRSCRGGGSAGRGRRGRGAGAMALCSRSSFARPHRPPPSSRAAEQYPRTLSRSFLRASAPQTPLLTSTPPGRAVRVASATLSGPSPPARSHPRSASRASSLDLSRSAAQSSLTPLPPLSPSTTSHAGRRHSATPAADAASLGRGVAAAPSGPTWTTQSTCRAGGRSKNEARAPSPWSCAGGRKSGGGTTGTEWVDRSTEGVGSEFVSPGRGVPAHPSSVPTSPGRGRSSPRQRPWRWFPQTRRRTTQLGCRHPLGWRRRRRGLLRPSRNDLPWARGRSRLGRPRRRQQQRRRRGGSRRTPSPRSWRLSCLGSHWSSRQGRPRACEPRDGRRGYRPATGRRHERWRIQWPS